jgi:transcriptional regulator with XRE-family HTH domain
MAQADLGTSIGASVRSIKVYEAGAFAPDPHRLRRLARTLKFPERFFLGDDIGDLAPTIFRSPSKLTARQRHVALGGAAIAIAFNQEIERLYALPEPDLPNLTGRARPEQAAESLRHDWKLGEKPVEHILQLLEARGVRGYAVLHAEHEEMERSRPDVFALMVDRRCKPAGELRSATCCAACHLGDFRAPALRD